MKEPNDPSSPAPETEDPEVRYHPDGGLDDPLHEWWQKNGRSIIAGAVLAVAGTGLVFGFRAYRNAQEEAVQEAFNQALAEEQLASFALEFLGHPLAGIAALQAGHAAFAESDWGEALDFYTAAVDSLAANPLAGKARLGLAATRSKLGETAEAQRILAALASDEAAFPAARAEAMYFLALLALADEDRAGFDQWSSALAEVDTMSVWQNKLEYYRERVPIPVAVPEAVDSGEGDGSQEPGEIRGTDPVQPQAEAEQE